MSPVWNQPSTMTARGLVRPLEVPAHDVRPARQDFAVVGDADLDVRQRRPDRAEPNRSERHHRQHRRRLRQPVALENRQADAEEERGDVAVERRAAGHREPQPAADAVADLREHERSASARRPAPASRDSGWPAASRSPRRAATASGPLEDLALDAAGARRPFSRMRACSFSNTRGTPDITVGRTVSRSRAIVSIDSAKIIETPLAR